MGDGWDRERELKARRELLDEYQSQVAWLETELEQGGLEAAEMQEVLRQIGEASPAVNEASAASLTMRQGVASRWGRFWRWILRWALGRRRALTEADRRRIIDRAQLGLAKWRVIRPGLESCVKIGRAAVQELRRQLAELERGN